MEMIRMHTLPKLDYDYNALEPHIDAQTMTIHHTKHHQAYLDNLNKAIAGTEWESKDILEILKNLGKVPENIRNVVRNNAGGHYNHSLFWKMLGPNAGGAPSGAVADAINTKWGTFDAFKAEFNKAGLGRFGSGWAWLVKSGAGVEIMSTPNQDNPISEGKVPVLGVDVWEHSYYIKYQNRRADYLNAIWNVVNWKHVDELFKN
jgi:Fe-Mn family superoxide dismutase